MGILKPTTRHRRNRLERNLTRIVLVAALTFVPVYILVVFTGGRMEKLKELPDYISRLRQPVLWEIPEDGVKYLTFFHAPADSGHKFVLIDLLMQSRLKLGYSIVPRCFQLVDDQKIHYYPLSRSPLFIERGPSFFMDKDESFSGELLFQIPREHHSLRLTFDRYQE